MQQVIAQGVGGVEIVLREGECAGRGGGPGIHQGGLHHLILLVAAAHEAAAVFHEDVHVGTQIDAAALGHVAVAHDGGGDDGVDLDAGNIVAAGGQRAGDVPTAAGPDDQGFGAGTHGIGQGRPLFQKLVAFAGGEVREIEAGDAGGSVRVDEDGVVADGDAREAVPLHELFLLQLLALGVAYGDDVVCAVVEHEGEHGQRQGHGGGAELDRSRHAVPDGARGGEQHGHKHHGADAAEVVQKRHQQQASGRGAQQVEEIDAVDALDGLRNSQRNNHSGNEEWQGSGEVDQGQAPGAGLLLLRDNHGQRHDDQKAVEHA